MCLNSTTDRLKTRDDMNRSVLRKWQRILTGYIESTVNMPYQCLCQNLQDIPMS